MQKAGLKGSKRSQAVLTEGKYDGQSQQEVKPGRLVTQECFSDGQSQQEVKTGRLVTQECFSDGQSQQEVKTCRLVTQECFSRSHACYYFILHVSDNATNIKQASNSNSKHSF